MAEAAENSQRRAQIADGFQQASLNAGMMQLDELSDLSSIPVLELRTRMVQERVYGGRPIASSVPIYSPVLDVLYRPRGKSEVDNASTPIKMTLSGSVGLLDSQGYSRMSQAALNTESFNKQATQTLNRSFQKRQAERRAQESTLGRQMTDSVTDSQARIMAASANQSLFGSLSLVSPRVGRSSGGGSTATARRTSSQSETGRSEGHNVSEGTEGTGATKNKIVEEKGQRSSNGRGDSATAGGRATPNSRESAMTPAERGRAQAIRLASNSEAFRMTMTKLDSQAITRAYQIQTQTGTTPLMTMLRRIYRKQKLGDLEEQEALNGILLLLKMSGNETYSHASNMVEYNNDLAEEMGVHDPEARRQIEMGTWFKDIGEMGLLFSDESKGKLDLAAGEMDKIATCMRSSELRQATVLHDIGELALPEEVVHKTSQLTPEEYELMKSHPVLGEQMLYPIVSLRKLCPIVRGHHERWDGKGYPDGLKGQDIPLADRIIAVTDTFDSLFSGRPGKEALELKRVRAVLEEGRGTMFDPDCVDAFNRVLDRRHPSTTRRRAVRQRAAVGAGIGSPALGTT